MKQLILVIIVVLATVVSALSSVKQVQDQPKEAGYAYKASELLHRLSSYDHLKEAVKRREILEQVIDNQQHAIDSLMDANRILNKFLTYQQLVHEWRVFYNELKKIRLK